MFCALGKFASIVGVALLISGCIYYPKRVEVYDSDCNIRTRKLTLGVIGSNSVPSCSGGNAGACLAAIAAVGPVTAVVSGSIVVIGNTLYYMEKEGPCAASKGHDAS